MCFDESCYASKRLNVLVLPNAQVAWTDAAAVFDGSCFHNDETRTSHSAATKVNQMPVVCKAILGRVLAHWRNYSAILQKNVANLQGLKQACGLSAVGD
jgi:hypothetical protein